MRYCKECGAELNGENWTPARRRKKHYICKPCVKTYETAWREATNKAKGVTGSRVGVKLKRQSGRVIPECRFCSCFLTEDTWHPSKRKQGDYCCKSCNGTVSNKRRRQSMITAPEDEFRRRQRQAFNSYLKKNYQITVEVYEQMQEEQNRSCKLCLTHEDNLKRRLFVDHSHVTGLVRGLLCGQCNTLLGMAKDNIATLKRSIEYLESNP